MNMKKTWFAMAGSLLLSGPMLAQNPPQGNPEEKHKVFFYQSLPDTNAPSSEDMRFVTLMAESKTVKGAPYTAKEVTESTQMLSDGNRIVNKTMASVARDGEGRTRREEEFAVGGLHASGPKIVTIDDPVAHAQYVFGPGNASVAGAVSLHSGEGAGVGVGSGGEFPHGLPQKVRVFNLADGPSGNTVYSTTNERHTRTHFTVEIKPETDDVKHESLGSQDMEGVTVEGTRETRTIAAGAIGNEKPIVITVETWTSPDLQAVVLSKRNDPRFGETVYKLTEINRAEPDPSLFQPPSSIKKVIPLK